MGRASQARSRTPAPEVCLELRDNSVVRKSAIDFFQVRKSESRNPASQAAKLAAQFIDMNRSLTSLVEVRIDHYYDGSDLLLVIHSGNVVGAIPLISPQSARQDLGIVIQPRFPWSGIGPMLADMGWRITPSPLRLPLLRRSERRVPPWVLSSMVLTRLGTLLDSLNRKFEMTYEWRHTPRGRVNWGDYVRRSIPNAKFFSIPCSFPDLEDDRILRGCIRYTVERQIQSLETQKVYGGFIHRLLEFASGLLRRVQDVPATIPTVLSMQTWLARPTIGGQFLDGIQAIEWTVEERGLGGTSDLRGLAWRMPMNEFFEAWAEAIFSSVARRTGARLKTGRLRQTRHPIDWQPSYLGSQKSLVPDLWLEWDSTTMIIDAKYKRHWEEMNQHSWSQIEQQIREDHRNDLLQVLAYANLAKTPNVLACLVYPCSPNTWQALLSSDRLIHRAVLTIGSRVVQLWLTAVPMSSNSEMIAEFFSEAVRNNRLSAA